MKSQSIGRKTKRFFVLDDHTLSYFDNEEEATLENAIPKETLEIDDQSKLRIGTHFKSHCISLKTPHNALWFTAKTEELEREWYHELEYVINRFANKNILQACLINPSSSPLSDSAIDDPAISKVVSNDSPVTVTEYTWTPLRSGFTLIAVDAIAESAHKVQRSNHLSSSSSSGISSSSSSSMMIISTAALFGKPGDYVLECVNGCNQTLIYQVRY